MKIDSTQASQPKIEALPKETAAQAHQTVKTPPQAAPQAAPQNPAHLGKAIDTHA